MRTILITGASGEIGAELCKVIPKPGDKLFVTGRNRAKIAEFAASLGGNVEPIVLNLADLDSVESVAKELANKTQSIDLLIANAGVMATARAKTKQRFEEQMGVNHLGHFALVGRLLPLLKQAPKAKVVVTTSSAAWFGKMNFADLMSEKKYKRYEAYCQSKLANMLFALELNKLSKDAGLHILSNAAHPGFVYGQLQENALRNADLLEKIFYKAIVKPFFCVSVEKGIEPFTLAASEAGLGGGIYGPKMLVKGEALLVKAPKSAKVPGQQTKLWEVSEKLTGVSYRF